MPSVIAAGAIVAAGIGYMASSQQANAAQNAGQLQYNAAQQAAQMQMQMFQQMQGNLAPYMMTGQNALNNLSMLTGNSPMLSPEVQQWQQQLQLAQSALAAMGGTSGTSNAMTPGMQAAMSYGADSERGNGLAQPLDWIDFTGTAGNRVEEFFGMNNRSAIGDIWGALQEGNPISDESWAAAGYGPGGTALPGSPQASGAPTGVMSNLGLVNATGGNASAPAGVTMSGASGTGGLPTDKAGLQSMIADLQAKINAAKFSATPGNPLTAPLTAPFQPTMAQLEQTPGYQFTLNQGLKATQNAATAMGLGQSGPALAGAADYAAGLASQTYQQQFNNYWSNNMNLYNMLAGLTSLGQASAAGVGSAGIQSGALAGNMLTGGAAALGAGQIGAANAYAGGLSGIGSGLQNAAMFYAMRNNGLFGGSASTPATATYSGGNWTTGPGGFPETDTGGF